MIARLATAAAVLAVAMTAPGASAAGVTLDGQTTTSYSYDGSLYGPTVYSGMVEEFGTFPSPRPTWCAEEQTCHTTQLKLTLPRGRDSGRLVVDLTYKGASWMHVGVYDEEDGEVTPSSWCCGSTRVVAAQLPAGTYKVVVYDDAGQGAFRIDVSWKANRPHRPASTSDQP